jgi:hypothetical protein
MANVVTNPTADQSILSDNLLPAASNPAVTGQALGSSSAPWQDSYINLKVSNAIVYADQFPGSDAGAQIANALAALPSEGGIVDARGLAGTQSSSLNPFANYSGPGVLLLGQINLSISTMWTVPAQFQIIGTGRKSVTGSNTQLLATNPSGGSFNGSFMVQLGSLTGTAESTGSRLQDMSLNCNGLSLGCVTSGSIQEQAGLFRCTLVNFTTFGLFVDGTVSPYFAEQWSVDDCEFYGLTGAVGIFVKGTPTTFSNGPKRISRCTISGNSTSTLLIAGIELQNVTDISIDDIHSENYSGAALMLGNSSGACLNITCKNINGGDGATGPVIHINNSSTSSITIIDANGFTSATGTATIVNTVSGVTIPNGFISLYVYDGTVVFDGITNLTSVAATDTSASTMGVRLGATTSSTATAGSEILPSKPAGFWEINIFGSERCPKL